MDERKNLDTRASALMVLLCMILGLQQVALKIAATDITPIMQIALRSGLSALLVLPLLWRDSSIHLFSYQQCKSGALVALFFSLEFYFVTQALKLTSTSHTVVLLYTAPIFVALGLHWKFPTERLNRAQWGGITLAFMGIIITFYPTATTLNGAALVQVLLGDLYALMAGMAWALSTIIVRLSSLAQAPATQTLFYQLTGCFILLILIAFATDQTTIHLTKLTFLSLSFQTLIVSFASLLLWFWLLRNYLASRLGVFSFLTPLFGVLFSVLFLDEKLEIKFVAGSILVLSGIIIMSLKQGQPNKG
ncbi:DMT family transporter [Acinetobacter seifertii]|uniref:DMT family transporter n=1 Tax=Acinetobacter seifertii TaxID=1530123 RepID=A0A7H2NMN2_9GAMM|nr:DMT family transporter [Acinetobacter seifertii]MBZ6535418.1 DMT family transporter [Acinetobacter seifertii]QNW91864.1 DMT family transporter [Acinetobacter seifertii]QNX71884.1 DMT family transporter [Acinetobacter seifertii]